jgi:uroporphyrinogen III methyltransferase/synthase
VSSKTNGERQVASDQSPGPSPQSPLQDKRIVITRSQSQAASFSEKLQSLGAKPIVFPVIQFTPLSTESLDAALAQFEQYDWLIFTSVNAVDFFFRRVDELKLTLAMPKVATVGSATAVALQARHINIDYTPDEFVGEALAAGLGDLTGQKVLLPRAKIGRPQIVNLLRQQGAEVADVALYDTVTAVPSPEALAELAQGFDAVTFTSPSSVRNFLKILDNSRPQGFQKPLGSLLGQAVIACIGPITAEEARQNNLSVTLTPPEYTIDGLIQDLITYFEGE